MAAKLTPAQIAGYARAAGFTGQGLVLAIAVALAESGGDPGATYTNTGGAYAGSRDRGLWQINDRAWPQVSDSEAYNPATSAAWAFRISRAGTNWQPWSTYTNGAYQAQIPAARQAAGSASPSPSPSPAGPTTAILFELPHYAGRSVAITADTPDLRAIDHGQMGRGGWNDRALSMRLLGGPVTIYEDTGYSGKAITYDASVPDFRAAGIRNSQTSWPSSIKIGRPGNATGPGYLILYDRADFQGRSYRLTHTEHYIAVATLFGRQGDIRSIKNPSGTRYAVYRDINYQGPAVITAEDMPDTLDTSRGGIGRTEPGKVISSIVIAGSPSNHPPHPAPNIGGGGSPGSSGTITDSGFAGIAERIAAAERMDWTPAEDYRLPIDLGTLDVPTISGSITGGIRTGSREIKLATELPIPGSGQIIVLARNTKPIIVRALIVLFGLFLIGQAARGL